MVFVSFDASASSIIATKASASSITSSQASVDALSQATVTSSDNGGASSGGLSTSDKISIGIGLPGGVAGILCAWFGWKAYQHKKNKSKK